jgi:predicted ester cyclase
MSPVKVSATQTKAAIRHLYQELEKKNQAILDENYAPNVVVHALQFGIEIKGLEMLKPALAGLLAAFPDIRFTVEDIVAEADKAAFRIAWAGTQKGEFMNQSPTGKKITQTAFVFLRYEGDKIAEQWEK